MYFIQYWFEGKDNMLITKDNIGDVLCSYENGKRIMITDVSDHIIKYMTESWSDSYNTNEKSFNGTIDYSLDARLTFMENVNYARVMDYAEISALQKILSGNVADKEDGDYMLITISKQREAFIQKINQQALGRKSFLFKRFKQEFNEMGLDRKINFFGNIVEKSNYNDGYVINGNYYNKEFGESFLFDKDPDLKKVPSFNDLIHSARLRSDNQRNIDSKVIDNITEPERE